MMLSQPDHRPLYDFGPFRLDPTERTLLRDGEVVALTPKAFDLLVYLVERHGSLVEKRALVAALWPDTIVEEGNLTFTVSMLRKVLDGGNGGTSMIQTVPTRGYRFVAMVTISSRKLARRAQLEGATRLGPYHILESVGGGNGKVYQARDTRLDRIVAIKVLRPDLTSDPTARQRFEGEAQAVAALSNPHICSVLDIGHQEGTDFLVMEYLEGETLAHHLAESKLPVDVVLAYAIQIADALAAAHRAGLVHGHLKPGNIIVTKSGTKLLNLARRKTRPELAATPLTDVGTHEPLTDRPQVIGSIQYLAPEQLEGQDGDARSDLFAFGAILYEMLSGSRAFDGGTPATVVGNILRSHPPLLSRVVPLLPPALDHVVQACLAKNPEERWQAAQDVLVELRWIQTHGAPVEALPRALTTTGTDSTSGGSPSGRVRPALWRRVLPAAIIAIMSVGWLLLSGRASPPTTPRARPSQRLSVELGSDGTLPVTDAPFVLSQDGTVLAFVARRGAGAPQLHVRHLDRLTATLLDGTEGASSPFFSPDGQWVAFFADLKLKKIPVTGGAVVTLADAVNPRGGWWAEDNTIVFAPHYRRALMRVSAMGGDAQPLTRLAQKEITHRWPQVLPGGAAVLYTASTEVDIGAAATLVVQRLPSGECTVIQRGGYFGRYVASGHIVYMRGDTLFAMPFDRHRLTVTGAEGRAIEGVSSASARGAAQFAVSQSGTLTYLPGRNIFEPRPIAWMDRTGAIAELRATSADWGNLEFSPDGQQIAMDIRAEGQTDIWVYEWARDALTRVTSDETNEQRPVWTPDGERIVYRSFRSGARFDNTLAWRRADGTGDVQVLTRSTGALVPGSWHPTKKVLAYVATTPTTGDDVMLLPVEGDEVHGWKPGQPVAFVAGAANEQGPAFSPDGKWLAYYSNSNPSGRNDVYVQPFPGPGAKVIVSSDRSSERPSWSRSRRELVFTTAGVDYARVLMFAPYVVENDSFHPRKPQLWAPRGSLRYVADDRFYALHPDGLRVAVARPAEEQSIAQGHVTFMLDFFEELRRIAPPKPSH